MELRDLTTRQEARIFRGHSQLPSSVVFSPDGTRLVSASLDGTLKVWDVTSHQEPISLPGHADWATCVAYSPDGILLASSSKGSGTVKVWDITTGQLRHSLPGHSDGVWSVAFSPMRTAGLGERGPDGEAVGHSNRPAALHVYRSRQRRLECGVQPRRRRIASATGLTAGEPDRPGEVKIWDVHKLLVEAHVAWPRGLHRKCLVQP